MMLPVKIEALYVADTNALYWYLSQNTKLSKQASAVFSAAENAATQIVISAITVAELYWLNKKAKTFKDLTHRPKFIIVPFEADDVQEFDQDSAVLEMHDRIIAGLARRLGAPLLTSDGQITASGLVRVVW